MNYKHSKLDCVFNRRHYYKDRTLQTPVAEVKTIPGERSCTNVDPIWKFHEVAIVAKSPDV